MKGRGWSVSTAQAFGVVVVAVIGILLAALTVLRPGSEPERPDRHADSNVSGCRAPSIRGLITRARDADITVDEDVLMEQGEPYCAGADHVATSWQGDASFFVMPDDASRSDDRSRTVAAVDAAGRRLESIEQDTGEPFEEWEQKYAPGYISGPIVHEDGGVGLWLDTDGELALPLGRTVLRILVEELAERDVAARIGFPPDSLSSDEGDYLWDGNGQYGRRASPKKDTTDVRARWYVVRPVHTTTKDGRAYEDVDYWTEGGRWSPQRSDALDLARGDREKATALTERLRKAAKPSETYGEPTAVLLGVGEDPWPQPPASLERARQDSNLRPRD